MQDATAKPQDAMQAPRLLMFVTEDWFFVSHFLVRARAARTAGYQVAVLCRVGRQRAVIEAQGIEVLPIAMQRAGWLPWRELATVLRVWASYRRFRPDVVHHVAAKPIIYGSLAAWASGVKRIVNAPVGMGWAFTATTTRARIAGFALRTLYRWLLGARNATVQKLIADWGAAAPERCVLLPGAGVDIGRFAGATGGRAEPITAVLGARLLREKGVLEYLQAARRLACEGVSLRFVLAGDIDPGNPGSFARDEVRSLVAGTPVEWVGHVSDMPALLQHAHIACLPSYREGCSKFLQEAAAAGLAIVTCDVPGCSDLFVHERHALIVPPRDPERLADALGRLAADAALRARLGAAARELAESRFCERQIAARTLAAYGGPAGAP